jgi:hypothetical protein
MRTYGSAVFAIAVFTLGALPVSAQEARNVEVTPYVGVGTSGAFPVGTAVTFPLTSTLSLETDVAYRRAEGGINALSTNASLLYALPRVGQARPYVAGGVGLAQFGGPVFGLNGRPIGTQKDMALTVNAGGGLKMPMTNSLNMRTDARWFKSFGRQGTEQFRVAQGISFKLRKQ